MNKKIIAAALLCLATLTSCNGETVIEAIKNPVESSDSIVTESVTEQEIEEERKDYIFRYTVPTGNKIETVEDLTRAEYKEIKNEKLKEALDLWKEEPYFFAFRFTVICDGATVYDELYENKE